MVQGTFKIGRPLGEWNNDPPQDDLGRELEEIDIIHTNTQKGRKRAAQIYWRVEAGIAKVQHSSCKAVNFVPVPALRKRTL